MIDDQIAEFRAAIRKEQAGARKAAKSFARAVQTGDPDGVAAALQAVDDAGAWTAAFRHVAKPKSVNEDAKPSYLSLWQSNGDTIRSNVNDDLVVIDALKVLLPRYEGEDLILYRGESFANRRNRTYGLSWTSDRTIATDFAESRAGSYSDGSALVSCHAPTAAIIARVPANADRFLEKEHLVDRRLIRDVRLLARLRNN